MGGNDVVFIKSRNRQFMNTTILCNIPATKINGTSMYDVT